MQINFGSEIEISNIHCSLQKICKFYLTFRELLSRYFGKPKKKHISLCMLVSSSMLPLAYAQLNHSGVVLVYCPWHLMVAAHSLTGDGTRTLATNI